MEPQTKVRSEGSEVLVQDPDVPADQAFCLPFLTWCTKTNNLYIHTDMHTLHSEADIFQKQPFILKQQMCQRKAFVSTKQESDSNFMTMQRLKKKKTFSWANDINYTIREELRFNLTNQTDEWFCVIDLIVVINASFLVWQNFG